MCGVAESRNRSVDYGVELLRDDALGAGCVLKSVGVPVCSLWGIYGWRSRAQRNCEYGLNSRKYTV